MKIVFLDAATIGNVNLSGLVALGEWVAYDLTNASEVVERCIGADAIITNKVNLMQPELEQLPDLKLICIAATGMNNVDRKYAAEKGIIVKNVPDYSTNSVAELTFTLALNLIHEVRYYDDFVKNGDYAKNTMFTHNGRPFFEINGKKWGIIGMGTIGNRVAGIAKAFGAEVTYFSTSGKNLDAGYPHQSLEELLAACDIISIHAPLNDATLNLLEYEKLCLMKPSAYLINVGRGGIVNENDLAQVLRENRIAGAGVDVFTEEPILEVNPLLAKDIQDKLLLTPHIAWASQDARQCLVDTIEQHIRAFF